MTINQSSNRLNDLFNQSNHLLNNKQNSISSQQLEKVSAKNKILSQIPSKEENLPKQERNTYGLISLELMNDDQYMAFQRITANMSHNEKISIAQMLTRAGNLDISVERIEQQEKSSQQEGDKGFLGITSKGWESIAQDFQRNLNNLNHHNNLYSKTYNKNPTSNYNDILRKNQDAKTQRILREFSHAIHLGNTQIDKTA